MSFVFPALLGTLVLAGIPVVLHLILRRKPKTLPFPAFRFLVAKHQANQRKLQLRHLLLLALRMLLIAGLILAIARPRLLQQNLGLNSERPVAAVLVVDISPSMDARSSDNRSRLDDAKKRAIEFIDELPAGSRIAVLSSSDKRGDWQPNAFQARQRVGNLKIEYASPPLPQAVIVGLRMLNDVATKREDDVGTRLPRLLCVLSDTTRGAWNPALTPQFIEASDVIPVTRESLLESRRDIDQLLKGDVGPLADLLKELRDTMPRLPPAEFPLRDRPLQLVQQIRAAARDQIKAASPGDEQLTPLRSLLARLTGYQSMWFDVGLDPARDLAILDIEWPVNSRGTIVETVRPDGKITLRPVLQALGQDFQATLNVGNDKKPRDVPQGTRVIVPMEIDAPTDKSNFLPLEFAVGVRDVLAINNQRYATIALQAPRKVLVITDVADLDKDRLLDALPKNPLCPVQPTATTPAKAEAGIPASYDGVILYNVASPSDGLWQAIANFAKGGGGVAIVPAGDEMDLKAYQTAAAQAVLPGVYQKAIRIAKVGDLKGGTRWDWLRPGVFNHSLLQPFEKWQGDQNIDFVRVPPRVMVFWETKPAAADMVLVRYQEPDQRPALLERKLGAGKVVQLTTPLDLRDPAWNTYLETIHSFYVVMMSFLTCHLTGELDPQHVNFILGRDEIWAPTRSLAGRGPLTLKGPETANLVVDDKAARTLIAQANVPGNYAIHDSNKNVVAAFSVNLASDEIDLTPWLIGDLENLFGPTARIAPDRQANLKQLLEGHWNEPVELFPFFMVALLVLLAVENLLANRFYRREE